VGARFEGHEGVATFGASLGGTIHSTLTNGALFEAGDQVVQFGRSRGTVLANNAVFDVPEVHVWTLRSGLVTAAAFYLDSSAMIRALAQAS
jgi:ketosteroid isomerase-like protein